MDNSSQTMTRYLLGQLSEQEQAALEKRYFSDPDVFTQVLEVESALVDDYARGRLSSEQREQFEQSYLTNSSRRDRVEFAKALTFRIYERKEPVTRAGQSLSAFSWRQSLLASLSGPRLRFAMVLAVVVVILVAAWIFVTTRRQQQFEAAQPQLEREKGERREREQTAQQQPPVTPSPGPQISPSPATNPTRPVAFLTLTAGGVRGADSTGTQTLTIPHDTTQAQIVLKLKNNSYPRYRVSLQKIGGAEIFTQSNLRPRSTKTGATFVFTLPASQLGSGDYVLTLTGITAEGETDNLDKSLFRVEKR